MVEWFKDTLMHLLHQINPVFHTGTKDYRISQPFKLPAITDTLSLGIIGTFDTFSLKLIGFLVFLFREIKNKTKTNLKNVVTF